ncbi:hypothetical protein PAMP_008228 [Pampus punctatissimus]
MAGLVDKKDVLMGSLRLLKDLICLSRRELSAMLLLSGQQVSNPDNKEWATMWILLSHFHWQMLHLHTLYLIHNQTLGHVMSQTRGKHSALSVDEVHRVMDGREEQGQPQNQE